MVTVGMVFIVAGATNLVAAAVAAICIVFDRIFGPWKARRPPWLHRAFLSGVAGLALIIGGIATEVL